MKIGQITWWRYNYGSILQAYALQQKLNQMGYNDVEIICQYGKKIASFSNLKEKLKRVGIKETSKRIIWKYGLRKLRKRNNNIQKFVDENLKVSEQEYNELTITESNKVYDAFICGSDQIWNPELVELDSMYWLNFAKKNKLKIAYAPSIGVENLTTNQKKMIKKNLKSFRAISSREETGTKLINDAINEDKCITVLDPTLLVERKIWDDLSSERKYDDKYVFVYMLRGTKKQRKLVEKYAKEKSLKIVTMPFLDNEKVSLYDFKFGDIKNWDASPKDFISLIRNAEYIFTDSFHCMLFSCMYHRSFYTFKKIGKAQLNRMYAFQKMIYADDRMINENYSISDIDNIKKIDWEKVDQTIINKRKDSEKYLSDALK